MPRKTTLDRYHWHEALDRACLLSEIFDQYLLEHPAIRQTPALRKRATRLSDALAGFYQAIGRADPSSTSSR